MASQGCNLILHSRDLKHTEKVLSEVQDMGVSARAVAADLNDLTAVERMLGEIDAMGVQVDIVLNNAGLQIDVFVGLLKGVTVSGEDRPAERQTQRFSGLTLSDAEVEDVFTIPLTFFLENDPEVHYVRMVPDVPADFPYEKVGQGPDYPWRESRYSVLIYDWPGRYLWGMTAKIVERFAAMLQE